MYFGAHVSVAGGLQNGPENAAAFGCEVFQFFSRSPQGGPAPKLTPEMVAAFKENCATHNIKEWVIHAPYYINLNSPEKEKLEASKKRILLALRMSELARIRSVCVHPAFYLGMEPKVAFENVRHAVDDIMKQKKNSFPHVNLGLETMGKPTQFGTLEEVLKISKEFDLYPVIDPAHMHARTNGKVNSYEEWDEMFDLYEKYLGAKSLKHVHMHYSGIAYTVKGEKHHLPLEESDAKWREFLRVLKDRKVEGTVVCESPLLEKDTLLMQKTYTSLS